jgi:hypothetical protein
VGGIREFDQARVLNREVLNREVPLDDLKPVERFTVPVDDTGVGVIPQPDGNPGLRFSVQVKRMERKGLRDA